MDPNAAAKDGSVATLSFTAFTAPQKIQFCKPIRLFCLRLLTFFSLPLTKHINEPHRRKSAPGFSSYNQSIHYI